jgi:transcriptional regulator with GAF, ATPase, and Fis domain
VKEQNASFGHEAEDSGNDPLSRLGIVIGSSKLMQEIAGVVRQVAAYPATTVLLQGESGTGKDVIARMIHALSRRAAYPFVDSDTPVP